MFVIRKKDNPKKIKAWGHTLKPGGLGEFDPTIYEEVQIESLPEGWEQATEKPLAMGRELANLAEKWIVERNHKNKLSFVDRQKIWSSVVGFFQYCNSQEANPLSKNEFKEIVNFAKQNFSTFLTEEEMQDAQSKVNLWSSSVRFEDE